jgi:Pentapeptide repeats (8 copies)
MLALVLMLSRRIGLRLARSLVRDVARDLTLAHSYEPSLRRAGFAITRNSALASTLDLALALDDLYNLADDLVRLSDQAHDPVSTDALAALEALKLRHARSQEVGAALNRARTVRDAFARDVVSGYTSVVGLEDVIQFVDTLAVALALEFHSDILDEATATHIKTLTESATDGLAFSIAPPLANILAQILADVGTDPSSYGPDLASRLAGALNRAQLLASGLSRDLREADLTGADLSSADLTRANLQGVLWSLATSWPDVMVRNIRAWSTEIEPGVFRVDHQTKGSRAETVAPAM